jgi:hypothetical protein
VKGCVGRDVDVLIDRIELTGTAYTTSGGALFGIGGLNWPAIRFCNGVAAGTWRFLQR